MKPVVVKIGGSLQHSPHLNHWLHALADRGRGRAVIVPGGGGFAEQIRLAQQRSGFDDHSAHCLALLAMAQYGHLLTTLQPGLQPLTAMRDIHAALHSRGVPVWLPLSLIDNETEVPASWDWSSDSIALWLAQQIDADLCLVKSVTPSESSRMADSLQQAGIVDRAFPGLLRQGVSEVYWLGPEQHGCFPELRAGARVTLAAQPDSQGVAV